MRLLVRFLSCLLGLALAAVGAVLVVEVGWAWAQPGEGSLLVPWRQWQADLSDLTWRSATTQVVAWSVAGAGLLLLLFALGARRRDVALLDPAPGVTVRTSPRSLARIVGTRVRAEDNVVSASVTATAKRVRVRAGSRLETEEQLKPRLVEVVRATLSDLPLAHQPRVIVVVDSPRDRRT